MQLIEELHIAVVTQSRFSLILSILQRQKSNILQAKLLQRIQKSWSPGVFLGSSPCVSKNLFPCLAYLQILIIKNWGIWLFLLQQANLFQQHNNNIKGTDLTGR